MFVGPHHCSIWTSKMLLFLFASSVPCLIWAKNNSDIFAKFFAFFFFSLCGICHVFIANKPVVLEEMLHNLDFCDVLVSGAELDPEQECLELDRTELQGKHLDATNSTAGYSIYGMFTDFAFPYFFSPTVTFLERKGSIIWEKAVVCYL